MMDSQVRAILNEVAALYEVAPGTLIGHRPKKTPTLVEARALVIWLVKTKLGLSNSEIGRVLGLHVSSVRKADIGMSAAIREGNNRPMLGRLNALAKELDIEFWVAQAARAGATERGPGVTAAAAPDVDSPYLERAEGAE